jgi:spore coat polysaccharide biosynthesis predicted glycosyltransferase SpsG
VGNLSRAYTLLLKLLELGCKDFVTAVFEMDLPLTEDSFQKRDNICFSSSVKETAAFIKKHQAKVLICDLPEVTEEDNAFLSNIQNIISLSDLNLNKLKPDILISSSPFSQSYPLGVTVYEGIEYFMVKSELLNRRPKEWTAVKDIKNIAVVFGGSDPGHFYERIFDDPPYNINLTLALGIGVSRERKKALSQKNSLRLKTAEVTELADVILNNDITVSLGGLTAFEALYLGKPAATVEYAHLSNYVRRLDEIGLLCNMGGIENFNASLSGLDTGRLNNMALNGYQSIDGKGADRVSALILETYRRIAA